MADSGEKHPCGPYWTKAWINAIWEFTNANFVDFDTGEVDYEALGREEYAFRKALFFKNFKNSERAKEAFEDAKEPYEQHVAAGKEGGRPHVYFRINGDDGRRKRKPSSKEEFYDFVQGQGLPEGISRDWYEVHVARGWVDMNGKPLRNWKGALCRYCESRLNKDEGD